MIINHLLEGGEGSGYFGHPDVPGRRGGSAPSPYRTPNVIRGSVGNVLIIGEVPTDSYQKQLSKYLSKVPDGVIGGALKKIFLSKVVTSNGEDVLGVYTPQDASIRLKTRWDSETIAHEIGHSVFHWFTDSGSPESKRWLELWDYAKRSGQLMGSMDHIASRPTETFAAMWSKASGTSTWQGINMKGKPTLLEMYKVVKRLVKNER